MTKTYYPFDAGAGANVVEASWREMARNWIGEYRHGSGVLAQDQAITSWAPGTLEASGDASGRQVKVSAGEAWVQGHYFKSTAQETIAIAANGAADPRWDRLVLRVDAAANTVDFFVVVGTAAPAPTRPPLTRTATIWDVPLARVLVGAGVATINAADVFDERNFVNVADPLRFKAAGWISPLGNGALTTISLDNNLRLAPIWIPRWCIVDRFWVEVTTTVATQFWRSGIYSDTGEGRPNKLLAEFALTDTGFAGLRAANIAPTLVLPPGLYWLGGQSSAVYGGYAVGRGWAGSGVTAPVPYMTYDLEDVNQSTGWGKTASTGALPSTISPLAAIGGTPLIRLRVASFDPV